VLLASTRTTPIANLDLEDRLRAWQRRSGILSNRIGYENVTWEGGKGKISAQSWIAANS